MKRPVLNLPFSNTQRILLALGVAVLALQVVLVATWYPTLPDTIPVHFNARGEADGYGAKGTLLAIPAISALLALGLLWLSRKPHVYNYPLEITTENAARVYAKSTTLMLSINLWVQGLFAVALFEMNPRAPWESWPLHHAVLGLVGLMGLQVILWLATVSKEA